MRPSRVSSEAPEAVLPDWHHHDRREFVLSPSGVSDGSDAMVKRTGNSQYQKQVDDREMETKMFPPPPREPIEPSPFMGYEERIEEKRPSRHVCWIVILILLAFLLGGGIGGGVGGVIAERNRKSKSPTINQPTVTVTAPATKATTIVDQAGCPLINNSTYPDNDSPGPKFLRICMTDIASPEGKFIDLGSKTVKDFKSCLDACAAQEGCKAASWVVFSADDPKSNSVCFLKSSSGEQIKSNGTDLVVASGFLQP